MGMFHADMLVPVDVARLLPRLSLQFGQVCQLAGITRMQLDYWTGRANIPTRGVKQRLYDYDAVELVLLIKQARDLGLSLDASITAAKAFVEKRIEATRPVARAQDLRGIAAEQAPHVGDVRRVSE